MLETFAEFIQAVVLIQATKRLHVCVHRYFVIAEEIMWKSFKPEFCQHIWEEVNMK